MGANNPLEVHEIWNPRKVQSGNDTTGPFRGDNRQRPMLLVALAGVLLAFIGLGWQIYTHYHPHQDQAITTGKIIDALGEKTEAERAQLLAAIDALYRIEQEESDKAEPVREALALLKQGDTSRAEDILRARVEERRRAGRGALREAATMARHLGAFVYMHDTKKALESYREAVELDPEDLTGCLELGRVTLRAGDSGEASRAFREFARRTERGADLHQQAIAQTELGGLDMLEGDIAAALKHYQRAESLLQRWADQDPGDLQRQRDLSVSHNKIGDMLRDNGDGAKALLAYRDGLAIAEKLARMDPLRVQWKTDLVVSLVKMSVLETDKTRKAEWLPSGPGNSGAPGQGEPPAGGIAGVDRMDTDETCRDGVEVMDSSVPFLRGPRKGPSPVPFGEPAVGRS